MLLATGDLYLANVAWFQGNYQTAFQLLTQADKKAEAANDPLLRIMVKNTRGLIYWTLNDTDKGLLHLHDAARMPSTTLTPLVNQFKASGSLPCSRNNVALPAAARHSTSLMPYR